MRYVAIAQLWMKIEHDYMAVRDKTSCKFQIFFLSILIKGRYVCLSVCVFAFSDKTTEAILTNDGSMEPLGPWSGHNGPGYLNFRPEDG